METKVKDQNESKQRMDNHEFREFFIDQLKDIYWAEKALHKALPKLMEASTSEKLAKAFEKHTMETEEQIGMVEQVFELLGEKPEAKKCDAMEGLIKEAESVIKDTEKDSYTRDAGLILAGQKVEHYEIASYGTLVIFADLMGETEAAKLLQKILDNEKETDVTLTRVAENFVNERAVME